MIRKIVRESITHLNEEEESFEESALKVIDKCKENLDQFKSAANNKLERYVEFIDELKDKREAARAQCDGDLSKFYALYDGDYSVAIKTGGYEEDEDEEGGEKVVVFKHNGDEGEVEEIFSSSDEETVNSYKSFYDVFKEHIEEVKNEKKEEEQQEKLQDFLKESRRYKRKYKR